MACEHQQIDEHTDSRIEQPQKLMGKTEQRGRIFRILSRDTCSGVRMRIWQLPRKVKGHLPRWHPVCQFEPFQSLHLEASAPRRDRRKGQELAVLERTGQERPAEVRLQDAPAGAACLKFLDLYFLGKTTATHCAIKRPLVLFTGGTV